MEPEILLETRILAILRRKSNYHKYKPILKPGFFQTEATRQLFTFIDDFFSGPNPPKRMTIEVLKLRTIRNIRNKDLLREIEKILLSIETHSTKDTSGIEESIRDFATRQLIKQGILLGLEQLDNPNPNFTQVKEQVEQALLVSSASKKGFYSYFTDPGKRLLFQDHKKRISTGIPVLDTYLDGGIGGGELIVFIAPPERGKTMVMINIGTSALYQGKTVGFLTLELSERKVARRFDLRITGRTLEVLRMEPERIKNPLSSLRKNGCDLVIKDYSSDNPTLEDIKSFIVTYQARMKKKFDLLIIDYADLINPSKHYKQERFGLKEIYTNLRRLANELEIPIVTASQANRKAMDQHVVGMKDFDECFAKAAIADVVIGICQTPEELEEEICRFYMAKNRITGKHGQLRLTFIPSRMFVGEFKQLDLSQGISKVKQSIASQI